MFKKNIYIHLAYIVIPLYSPENLKNSVIVLSHVYSCYPMKEYRCDKLLFSLFAVIMVMV